MYFLSRWFLDSKINAKTIVACLNRNLISLEKIKVNGFSGYKTLLNFI